MNNLKIIFLDINGVLNSSISRSRAAFQSQNTLEIIKNSYDDNCLNLLKNLVLTTDSYIVISSSWRKYPEYLNIFLEIFKKHLDEKRIIGATPNLGNVPRYLEIKKYLKETMFEIKSFVILDDNHDMNELNSNLVIINSNLGLTLENCQAARKILEDN